VNGALFSSATETAITGSPSNGVVYIYIDPSGPSAVFTNTAPTWSDSKQGWYGTGGSANCRYVPITMTKSSSTYSKKIEALLNRGIRKSSTRMMMSSQQIITSVTPVLLNFDTIIHDILGEANASTKTITLLDSGLYHLSQTSRGTVVTSGQSYCDPSMSLLYSTDGWATSKVGLSGDNNWIIPATGNTSANFRFSHSASIFLESGTQLRAYAVSYPAQAFFYGYPQYDNYYSHITVEKVL
jgi:hypothetical protein